MVGRLPHGTTAPRIASPGFAWFRSAWSRSAWYQAAWFRSEGPVPSGRAPARSEGGWHAAHPLLLLLPLLALLPAPDALAGQAAAPGARPSPVEGDSRDRITVIGSVVDAATLTPLPAVRVALRSEADTTSAAAQDHEAVTDGAGRFVLEGVPVGSYTLEVRALGYGEIDQPVRVAGASPFDIQVRLAPEALPLEGVVVTSARSPRLAAAGFYDRRGRASGDFLTRDEIEARGALRTVDLLNRFAGVRILTSGRGGAGIVTLRGGCRPDIIVDGVNLGPNLSPDEIISPRDLEGLELYRGPGAPLNLSRSTCGAVILWSADPALRAEGGEPFSWRRLAAAGLFVVLALWLTQ